MSLILEPIDFVHLHAHSYYSLLDGLQDAGKMGQVVKDRGMSAVALTDHGVMSGIYDFVEGCKKAGIKPIIGNETYLAFGDAENDKDYLHPNAAKPRSNGHFLCLAKNFEGYQNLLALTKFSYEKGFYRNPRIDIERFKTHAKGLVTTSTCISSHAYHYWNCRDYVKAQSWIEEIREATDPGSFFLELQHNNIESQKQYNHWLIGVSKKLDIPLVLTADAHHANKEDWETRLFVMCHEMNKTPDTFPYEKKDYNAWMYDVETAKVLCEDWDLPLEAIKNTKYVADLVDGGYFFDKVKANPLVFDAESEDISLYLIKKAKAGLIKRLGVPSWKAVPKEYQDRIKYEFQVISDAGYDSYFLTVADYIEEAKALGCPVAPGRGSSGGSLLSWALGITGKHMDPIQNNLLFERFLNPGRIKISLDFLGELS